MRAWLLLTGRPHEIATSRIGAVGLRFVTPSGDHDVGEHQWASMQRTNSGRHVHGGDIPDACTDGLGLNMEVRLGRVSGVSDSGKRLANLDLITDLDLDTPWTEMCHQHIPSAANVYDDVVAALIMAISRSDRLIGPAIENEGHGARGGCKHCLSIDVVTGQPGVARLVSTAIPRLENV